MRGEGIGKGGKSNVATTGEEEGGRESVERTQLNLFSTPTENKETFRAQLLCSVVGEMGTNPPRVGGRVRAPVSPVAPSTRPEPTSPSSGRRGKPRSLSFENLTSRESRFVVITKPTASPSEFVIV
ncbi:hypothetical protein ACHAWF_016412 [Thalassiosira exigua]